MVVLTEQLVLARTKASSLADVRNLNLWGNDLTDMSILKKMGSVEVLSLSVNKISSLADFSCCSNLTELYLRKNEIASLSDLEYLVGLSSLKTLWLSDNPCASHELYRLYVISKLPTLTKLDGDDITAEQRAQAARTDFSSMKLGKPVAAQAPQPAPRSVPSAAAPPSNPAASARGGGGGGGSPNVLSAVLTLLNDLDPDALTAVKSRCDQLLRGR